MSKKLKKLTSGQVKGVKKDVGSADTLGGKGGKNTKRNSTYRHEQSLPSTDKWPLSRGWVELKLIHELAKGEKTQRELAKEYGVSSNSISVFNRRHSTRIQEVKDDISNELAGLWVAQKRYRIAEYQKDLDRIEKGINALDAEDGIVPIGMLRLKHKALAALAEELGQLPPRIAQAIQSERLTYLIPGVDLEQLK